MARHYLIYYNGTHSRLDGTWQFYCAITYFEMVCIAISYLMLVSTMYLLWKTNAHHFNIRMIWGFIGIEYFTQLTNRIVQIFLIFNHEENGQVSLLLPAIVVERLCACYYLKDYERKKRSHISFLILLTITSTGLLLSIEYHRVESTLVLHFSMLIINMIASIINLMIEKYNYRKLRACTNLSKSHRGYSLAERFQVSENIKTCLVLKNVVNCVSFFNLLSTVMAAMDNFDLSILWTNVAATVANISVLIYGSLTMIVFYLHTEPWRNETRRLLAKVLSHHQFMFRFYSCTLT
ncbi:Sre G protein-coupled chemoreceptor [Ancylostoma caninum]|uniref:Sre G protein-coupled chemoreceptor n=1 Tax=Ancylostoma caninum TaxID=29170 RepID=A0A368GC84_ANCCA|nr:Sre G protein-coupled chemoreceptor [Ancylostoma caninum]